MYTKKTKIDNLSSKFTDLLGQEISFVDTNDKLNFFSENTDNNLEIFKFSESDIYINEVPDWIVKSNFERTQTDLISVGQNGKKIIFSDYFSNHDLPSILTQNGLFLKSSTIETLAGSFAPNQFVQVSGSDILSIGEVTNIKGNVKATRLDGNVYNLSNGDPVFKGDVIETDSSGSVGLVFLDKTTMSLSDGGKMVLDELVYDPSTGVGSMAVDMLEGAFSFVSGEIAKNDDAMTVSTPVATIGIRGTTVAGKAAVEGNENAFTLLQDADGGVGQISISNDGGTQVLAEVGATTSISSFTTPPPPPIILSAAQIEADYGNALNVLPPTPVIAPQPQAAPPPPDEQQIDVQESVEEESEEDGSEDEEILEESSEEDTLPEDEAIEGDEDAALEGEDELLEEEALLEEEVDSAADEEGDEAPVGPDGETLTEDVVPVGPDGETFAEDGPPAGPNGEVLAEDGAPVGSDGELPLIEGSEDLGQGGPETNTAREAFEETLRQGGTPEEAMAEAIESGAFPELDSFGGPGDFGANVGPTNSNNQVFDEEVLAEFRGVENQGFSSQSIDSFGGDFLAPGTLINEGNFLPSLGPAPVFGSGPNVPSFASGGPSFGPGGPSFGPGGSGFGPGGPSFGPGGSGFGSGEPFFGPGGPVGPVFGDTAFMGDVFDNYENNYEDQGMDYFEDPSLYDDFQNNYNTFENEVDTEESENSSSTQGTSSNDTLTGTNASDNISGLDGNDTINGNEGDDILNGGNGLDTIRGGDGNDTINGGQANDELYGGLGNDIIYGGAGADNITGGQGVDTIYGGVGSDTLRGGGGNDNFVFTELTDAIDTIKDFAAGDRIIAEYGPTHPTFTRSGVEPVSSSNINFSYDINANNNKLPNFINFNFDFDNIPSGDYHDPVEVSKAFNFTFIDSNDAYDSSGTILSEFMIITGDGINSAMFHWSDNDYDGTFNFDDSELTLLGTLENFDNDLLTANELTTSLT